MAAGADAVQVWIDLRAWLEQHLPEALETLNPGAEPTQLAAFDRALEQEIGRGLPGELRAVYLENDGQEVRSLCGVFFGLVFLSAEDALAQWRDWREIAAADPNLAAELSCASSYPAGAIKPEYINLGRVPFAYDWGGNHLGIDLDPGPKGRLGQVINFGSDEENKYVLAPSFGAFLSWLLEQYRGGRYRPVEEREESGLVRRLEPLEAEHFLDAVPRLFGPARSGQRAALPSAATTAAELLLSLAVGEAVGILEGQLPPSLPALPLPGGTDVVASYSSDPSQPHARAAVVLSTQLEPEAFAAAFVGGLEGVGWRRLEAQPQRSLIAMRDDWGFDALAELPGLNLEDWVLTVAPLGELADGGRYVLHLTYQRGVTPRVKGGGLLELLPQLRVPGDAAVGVSSQSWDEDYAQGMASFTAALPSARVAEHFVVQLAAAGWRVTERLEGERAALTLLERSHGRMTYEVRVMVVSTSGHHQMTLSAARRF